MKFLKDGLVILLLFLVITLIVYTGDSLRPLLWAFSALVIGLFILNYSMRKSLAYKDYFMHRFNVFTSKHKGDKTYDLPIDLLFDKIIEVINHSKYKLIEIDKTKHEILANSTFSYKSWGENLYISFEEDGEDTKLNFCSVTILQLYSWGKNEENFDDLLKEIDRSFTI